MAKKNKSVAVKKNDGKAEVSTMVVTTNVSETVSGLKKKSAPLVKIVKNFVIKTKEKQEKLVETLSKIKKLGELAETEESLFVDPAKKIIAQSKKFFKPFLDSVEAAQLLGKQKILAFVNTREEKSKLIGKSSGLSVGKLISKQNELEDNDNTRKLWKLHITKLSAIPRKYLVPDETKIKADLKKGKKIPGCTMRQENTIIIP